MLAPSFTLLGLLALLGAGQWAAAVRVHLYPEEEPESAQIYNNKRMLTADPSHYYLASAGLLRASQVNPVLREDARSPSGDFLPGNFAFNSSEYLRKQLTLKWFVPYEERTGLHNYDDPRDLELAAGPQVDQDRCGLHLDYMVHMVERHYRGLVESTEFSIFKIMNSYDAPRIGVDLGNNIFPGHYHSCLREKLNVMKRELDQVNRSASELYFRSEDLSHLGGSGSWQPAAQQSSAWRTLKGYLSPFLGFPKEPARLDLRGQSHRIRLASMRYCYAAIRWPSWPNSTHDRRDMVYRTAACLPAECDSRSLALHGPKIKRLTDTAMSDFHKGYYIQSLYCLPDEQSALRSPFTYTSSVLFIAFNCCWLATIALATLLHRLGAGHRGAGSAEIASAGWRYHLHSFSLIKNTRDFWAAKRRQPSLTGATIAKADQAGRHQVDLDPLEGFKVLSSLSVITSHALVVEFGANWNNIDGEQLISRSWIALANVICPAIVDNFFVTTGIITVMIVRTTSEAALFKASFWLKFLVYRYIRIVPLYLFGHWFLASTFRFLGSGPFWDYGTSRSAWSQVCQQESWWTYVLPSANFKSPASHCFGVGWYLANDIQFALVTPLIMVLYAKRPLLARLSTLAAVVGMMASHVRYYYLNASDPRSVFEWSVMGLTRVLDDTSSGYVNPQYRSLAYLVGIGAGHLLHSYSARGAAASWPRAFSRYGKWLLFLTIYLLCAAPYVTTLFPLDSEPFVRPTAALMEGLLHGITSIASAVFILLLVTGHLPALANFYRMRLFRPFANTALCTLLIHIPLQFYHVQTMRSLPELSLYHCVVTTLVWSLESFLLSIVVHVVYELPLRKCLVNMLRGFLSEPPGAALEGATSGPGSGAHARKAKLQ